MKFHYLFKQLIFCFFATLPLFVVGMEELADESSKFIFIDVEDLYQPELNEQMKTMESALEYIGYDHPIFILPEDHSAVYNMRTSLNIYLQEQKEKLSDIRPGSFEQSVGLLYSVLSSMRFQRGRFAFGKDSIEIYNERIKKWEQLRDVGNPIFYSWFNDVVGEVCDSDENIKRFVAIARNYFMHSNENSEDHKVYIKLLKQLPESICDRIKQRYVFEELQDWVKKTDHVCVSTILKDTYKIKIHKSTKIKDVKQELFDNVGVPVSQQALYARLKGNLWTLYTSKLIKLSNDRYVKEVMDSYNTNALEFCLMLRAQADDEDN